jgi:hypothetical protein
MTVLCLCVYGQEPVTPAAKEAPATEIKGLPPRGTPADYQARAKAGTVTLAAEFMRHAVPTPQGEFSTEDYVVVEAGLFGGPGEHSKLNINDFSLRVNGKKPLPSRPFGMVLSSLKDPNWEPPEPAGGKEKSGGISTGGGGGQDSGPPPPPPHMPLPLQRIMEQKVQKAALPEGDRALPVAGLLFFQYRGKGDRIASVELVYSGPAGKAALTLQP